eukprot:209362-Chlamydomonas_euryale.AAC.1
MQELGLAAHAHMHAVIGIHRRVRDKAPRYTHGRVCACACMHAHACMDSHVRVALPKLLARVQHASPQISPTYIQTSSLPCVQPAISHPDMHACIHAPCMHPFVHRDMPLPMH